MICCDRAQSNLKFKKIDNRLDGLEIDVRHGPTKEPMMRKALLSVFALVEMGAGLALVVSPPVLTTILFGTTPETPTALITGRIAGIALLSLVTACWIARNDPASVAATGVVGGMLLYNLGVVVSLFYAGTCEGLVGVGLWPAVVTHALLAVWCVACLGSKRISPAS